MEKTKTELYAELRAAKEQLARYERMEQYKNAANETRAMFDSFVQAGFTEDQAMGLILKAMEAAR